MGCVVLRYEITVPFLPTHSRANKMNKDKTFEEFPICIKYIKRNGRSGIIIVHSKSHLEELLEREDLTIRF